MVIYDALEGKSLVIQKADSLEDAVQMAYADHCTKQIMPLHISDDEGVLLMNRAMLLDFFDRMSEIERVASAADDLMTALEGVCRFDTTRLGRERMVEVVRQHMGRLIGLEPIDPAT